MESRYTAVSLYLGCSLPNHTKYHIHFSFYDFTHSSIMQCLPFPESHQISYSWSKSFIDHPHYSSLFRDPNPNPNPNPNPATEFLKLYCLHKFSLMFLLLSSLPLEHPSPLGRESADSASKNSVCTNSVQTLNRVKGSRSFCCWMINRTKSWVPTNF